MKAAVADFFELPFQEKKKYAKAENEIEGYGQNFVVTEHQKLDWSDMIFLFSLPSQNRNFKFWPLSLPGFKYVPSKIFTYSNHVYVIFSPNHLKALYTSSCIDFWQRSNGRVLERNAKDSRGTPSQLFSINGVGKRWAKKVTRGELKQGIRMNYYPICSRPDLVLGCSPHSDSTSFTLLLQDDDVTGLQIKHNEAWVPIKPIPNSLVVNIGDATEVIYIYIYIIWVWF